MSSENTSHQSSDFYKPSKISFSLEMLLDDFSIWFPKARDYGFTATDLYKVEENAIVTSIPLPILEGGNYKLWLFCFARVDKISPRSKELLMAQLIELFELRKFLHFEYYFIIADVIRGRIAPKFGRRTVYVIKAEYAFKVYEIIAKAILGFVNYFRRNLKYGEDLLILCSELEVFALKMRAKAEEMKDKREWVGK